MFVEIYMVPLELMSCLFFFNDTATTEIYTLSLHDALPISSTASARMESFSRPPVVSSPRPSSRCGPRPPAPSRRATPASERSEEHTSELQSRQYLVCRLLLEKKNTLANISSTVSDSQKKEN